MSVSLVLLQCHAREIVSVRAVCVREILLIDADWWASDITRLRS